MARIIRYSKAKVLLAEPNFHASSLEQIMQLFGYPLPVIPRMAQEDITKVRLRCRFQGCLPTVSRIGGSDRTWEGVYIKDEPGLDQLGFEPKAAKRGTTTAIPCMTDTTLPHIRRSYCRHLHMQDMLPDRSLCDDLLMVLCI
ncbi:hypothetical protein RI528_04500 [Aeromonas veronii]